MGIQSDYQASDFPLYILYVVWWESTVTCGPQQVSISVMTMIKTCSIPYQTSFPPHPSCFPVSSPSSSSLSDPIRAEGSCRDSSCIAEERAIKRRRPKEEVKGPGELLPPKRTHRVLGTGNFSQGGSVWSVLRRPGPALQSVCSLSPHHRPTMTPHTSP